MLESVRRGSMSPSDVSKADIIKSYHDLIRRMVGEQSVQSSAPRPFPQFPSMYYDGANDKLAFNNWLRTLLLYFRASMMCGEEHDDLRVTTAASYLKGIARDWFFARVAAPGSSIPYNFEEVIIEMVQVFLAPGSFLWPGRLPKYVPGTSARAFYFQIQHQYEIDATFGTGEQRDSFIQHSFLQGIREGIMEMNSAEGESIVNWYVASDTRSKEAMVDRVQRMFDALEQTRQERPYGRW